MEKNMDLLKLCDLKEVNESRIEFDYYVPFSIEIGNKDSLANEDTVYWRTGDIEKSLIEFGIGSKTGVLRNLTLTAVKNAVLNDVVIKSNKLVEATPFFDLGIIPDSGIYDCINDFQVCLEKEAITTIIGEADKCHTLVRFGRTNIGFNYENYITHVTVNKLTIDEYRELKNALKL
ncbi:hypothetical protein [Paenibacillus sp. FSL R7-0337]|uniref:hypothetical protein n=1 Tax=Paenibacillus sp. FSL R7-0337 TaxID=1926588 RepID=UPI00096E2432|nr:hypothetical protein [Paenibacillus sp. FSL R7-0337]OMF92095.1 hypothetical protein BK147_20360 [Paenibacillus sp. FSL R7-0337]